LDAEGAQTCEGGQIFELRDLVLSEPEALQFRQSLDPSNLLYPVRAQLEVNELSKLFEVLDRRYPVLDEVDVVQLFESGDVLDVFQLIVAQVQTSQLGEVFQAVDVLYEVIVEFEFYEGRGAGGGKFDVLNAVLAEA